MGNVLMTTYKLAFIKRAVFGPTAKSVGRFLASVPFWVAGGALAGHMFGKSPERVIVRIPRAQYARMRRQRIHRQLPYTGSGYPPLQEGLGEL